MNFLEKLKPHINSEDNIVQLFILQALTDYPRVPEEWTAELIQDAIESSRDISLAMYDLQKHTLNEQAVKLIIRGLHENKDHHKQLHQLVNQIPPHLAVAHKKELSPYLPNDQWDLYNVLLHGDEEQVWEEYGSYLAQLQEESSYNDRLFRRAKLIAKTIAEKGWVDDNEFRVLLNENLNGDWFDFAGILAVYMIGLMDKTEYVPLLVGMLAREEEDSLLEEVADVLSRFQSDDIVKAVLPYAKQGNVYAISILGETKSAQAVHELKNLYRSFKQPEDKEIVIEAICHQLSPEGIPVVEDFMKNANYQAVMIDLEQTVYGFYTVMGLEHPKLPKWKRIAEEKERQFQEYMQKSIAIKAPVQVEKVGRNDPCTCGSGKKYKKCCGL